MLINSIIIQFELDTYFSFYVCDVLGVRTGRRERADNGNDSLTSNTEVKHPLRSHSTSEMKTTLSSPEHYKSAAMSVTSSTYKNGRVSYETHLRNQTKAQPKTKYLTIIEMKSNT